MSDFVSLLTSFVIWTLVGMYLGVLIEKKAEAKRSIQRHQEWLERRKEAYTGQKCAECQSDDCDVYPAVCDTCGASWPAKMEN